MAETPKKDTKSDPSSDVTYPIMSLASRYHLLTHCSKSDLEADLKAEIKDIKAVHLWEAWGGKLGWGEVTAEVKKAYDEEEQGLKDELKKAEESSGETEILDAYFGLSNFYSRTGSLALSLSTLDSILSLPKLSTSKKIHALLGKARVLMFFDRSPTDVVAACDDAAEKGGDWDKRNRLKVYKALDAVSRRDFKKAAELLAGCVKTFSADELVDFKEVREGRHYAAPSIYHRCPPFAHSLLNARRSPRRGGALFDRRSSARTPSSSPSCTCRAPPLRRT